MTIKKIYSPWIKWHGGKLEKEYPAFGCHWRYDGDDDDGDIVEYRTVTEQPDLEAAEKLLRDNGYTVTPLAKPLTFEDVVPMTEAPPQGTVYWVVSAGEREGLYVNHFYGSDIDHRIIKRRMAYLDKEHALVAAKHIFGLKGGEL